MGEFIASNHYDWGWDERECVDISPDEYRKSDLEMMDFIEEEFRNKNRISFFSQKFLDNLMSDLEKGLIK